MRGQSLQAEELVKLFLVLIVGIAVLILILNASGELQNIIREFCEQNPQLCGQYDADYYARNERIANHSVEALVCAINSVAEGSPQTCVSDFVEEVSSPLSGNVLAQADIPKNATVICNAFGSTNVVSDHEPTAIREIGEKLLFCYSYTQKGEDKFCNIITIPSNVDFSITESEIKSWLRENSGDEGLGLVGDLQWDAGLAGPSNSIYVFADNTLFNEVIVKRSIDEVPSGIRPGTEESELECLVNDFILPQRVTDAEEWIIYYGDPEFIVYWNVFPHDEDTWTFEIDYKTIALLGAVSLIPGGKALSLGAKTGVTAFRSMGVGYRKYAINVIQRNLATSVGSGWVSTFSKAKLKLWMKEIAEKKGPGFFIKELVKESVGDRIATRTAKYLAKKGLTKAIKRGVPVTAAALAASVIDNISEKYIPLENQVALKVADKTREPYTLVDDLKGKPVFVRWTPEIGENVENLHFVSPCKADKLTVTKHSVKCGDYAYNKETDQLSCDEPEIDGRAPQECGVFDQGIDDYIDVDGAYEKVDSLLKSDKKLYEHNENLNVTKIYLPWAEDILYLDDIQKEGEERVHDPDRSGYGFDKIEFLDYFSARVTREGNQRGFGNVDDSDTVIMHPGQEYIIHYYGGDGNDAILDIYPSDYCAGGISIRDQSGPYFKHLTCEDIEEAKTNEVILRTSFDEIAELPAFAVQGGEGLIRYTPDKTIYANETEFEYDIPGTPWNLDFENTQDCNINTVSGDLCFRIPERISYTCYLDIDEYSAGNDKMLAELGKDNNLCIIDKDEVGLKTIIYREEKDDPYTYQIVQLPDKEKEVVLVDYDEDNSWDTITVGKYWTVLGLEIFEDKNTITYHKYDTAFTISNILEDGQYEFISMKNCMIETGSIIVDLEKSDINDEYDNNYCLRHKTTGQLFIKYGGLVLNVGSAIATVVFPNPFTAGLFITTTLADIGGQVYTEYKGQWP